MAGESLRVVSGNAGGKEISFEDDFEIGRAADGDGTLGDDPEISRRHARITRRAGDQLSIEDLGSTNGTFVNGKRVEAATHAHPRRHGEARHDHPSGARRLRQGAAGHGVRGHPARPGGRGRHQGGVRARPAAASGRRPAPPAAPARRHLRRPPPHLRRLPRPAAAALRRSPRPRPQPARSGGGGRGVSCSACSACSRSPAWWSAVLVLTGGDDGGDENKVLSTREIIDANRASTVRINTRGPARDDEGNRIVANGGGSGVVFNANRGLVLTNAHVVAGQSSIKVTIGKNEVNAVVRGRAPCEDLAVLELRPKPSGLKQAELGRAADRARGRQGHRARLSPARSRRSSTERRLQATDGTVSSGVTSATHRRHAAQVPGPDPAPGADQPRQLRRPAVQRPRRGRSASTRSAPRARAAGRTRTARSRSTARARC